MGGNREYKSDVFSMLMEDKKNALQVYNALNGTKYENPNEVEIVTLDRGISLTVRNDASFVLDSNLSIYEHQSTVCPNMPIRSLIYFSCTIEKRIKNRNIYGKSLVKIPTPRFVIFYNGVEEQPEQYKLKLSDAYEQPMENPELELTCTVYNINKGYAVFREVTIIDENEEFCIVESNNIYGLDAHDHIVLDASAVDTDDIVY